MKSSLLVWLAGSLLLATSAACGDDDGGGTTDAGTIPDDSGSLDTGTPPIDAGGDEDAGDGDSGVPADAGPEDGGEADAGPDLPTAMATIEQAEGDGTIMGTVTFVQDGADVTVTYAITDCPEGEHPTHIHAGTGCGNRGEQGMHWDVPRGDDIPNLVCDADGNGTLTYTREGGNPDTAWTVGDGAATDVVGQPLIIHGATPTTDPRIGCGVIELVP